MSSSLLLIWSFRNLNLQRETQAFTITSITCYYAGWKRKLGGSFVSKLLLWPKSDVACVRAQPPSHVRLCATPWTVACQASLSMKFPRQEYWSRLPFPSPGNLPDLGAEPVSPALAMDSLSLSLNYRSIILWNVPREFVFNFFSFQFY